MRICNRFAIAFVLMQSIAIASGEDERVRVAAAKVRQAMAAQAQLPDQPPNVVVKPNVMRLDPTQQKQAKYSVTVYTASWCGPCHSMRDKWGNGDETVQMNWVESAPPAGVPEIYPSICWQDASGTTIYLSGVHTPEQILKAIERNDPPLMQSGAMGSAGTIHGRDQIKAVIDWFRWRVGEDRAVAFKWDRTGQQSFPLLKAGADWSALALLGRSGRIELSTKNPVNLPVDSVGFGYILDGDDLLVDIDQTRFKRLFKQSEDIQPQGITPATVLTILGVIRSVYQLLHPQCDVQIGANVSAVATLNGDCLNVKFDNAPALRIVTLFTMTLGVDRVEIREDRVKLFFGGSRWIREREFVVR